MVFVEHTCFLLNTGVQLLNFPLGLLPQVVLCELVDAQFEHKAVEFGHQNARPYVTFYLARASSSGTLVTSSHRKSDGTEAVSAFSAAKQSFQEVPVTDALIPVECPFLEYFIDPEEQFIVDDPCMGSLDVEFCEQNPVLSLS